MLSRLRPTENRQGDQVPTVRAAAASIQGADEAPPLSRPTSTRISPVRTLPADLAWEKLAAPLDRGEGIRIGAIGITGSGKTTSIIAFIRYLIETHRIHLIIVHDIKNPAPQYEGTIEHEADSVLARPPLQYPAVAVLRRRDIDHIPSVELAARVTKHASYNGVPTMLVVDEFKRACSPSGREFEAPTIKELLSEGRAIGASLIWTTQIPQRVPGEAYDQSKVLIHRSGPKVTNYLTGQRIIEERAAGTVAQLRPGQFILGEAEDESDNAIYEVPPP